MATVPLPQSPLFLAVTPDNKWVYVASANDDNPGESTPVAVIDTATNTIVATLTAGSGPFAVAVKPDGSRVYVTTSIRMMFP